MADFNKFYARTAEHEGGYLSEADAKKYNDTGGETYKGVARNKNPSWTGWKIIDEYKAKNGIPKHNSVINNSELDRLVVQLFKNNYWTILKLDDVNNQEVAEQMADYGINSGPTMPAKAAQKSVGVSVDGRIGADSLKAINSADQSKLFNDIKNHRIDLITNSGKIASGSKAALIKRAKSYIYSGIEKAKEVTKDATKAVKAHPFITISITAGVLILGYVVYKKYLQNK